MSAGVRRAALRPFCFPDEYEEIRRAPADEQLVYFAQIEPGPIKVGVARCPIRRLSDIEVANPYEVTLRRVALGGARLETFLHQRWRRHNIRGEWFEPAPVLLDYIAGNRELHKELRAKAGVPSPLAARRSREAAAFGALVA